VAEDVVGGEVDALEEGSRYRVEPRSDGDLEQIDISRPIQVSCGPEKEVRSGVATDVDRVAARPGRLPLSGECFEGRAMRAYLVIGSMF
jgi:hypothetical protein